jgi:carbamoyltransferase
MNILGISCHYHDSAAALLRDGMLVAAAQEERFSRKKNDAAFPQRAIDFCLEQGNISARDVDYAVFYEKPFVKAARLMTSIIATFPKSRRLFQDGIHLWLKEKLWIKEYIRKYLNIDPNRILFVEHHLSHAASALYCSPFDEAAILTVDGVGEWTTATLGRGSAQWSNGHSNAINLSQELRFPHSIGLLYSVFTAFLGFEVNEGEYKVMGMAPFGEPKYVDQVRKIVELREDGSLWLDPAYISFPYHTQQSFTAKFESLFGTPRDPKARFVTDNTSLYDDPNPPTRAELTRNQYYADLAASIQKVTEEVMIAMAKHLHSETGLKKLCIAGGVGLNCVANYKVLCETAFEEIYVQPAAGDAGGALGAALYCYHVILGERRKFIMDHAYWGKAYSDGAVVDTLTREGVTYQAMDEDRVLQRVVDSLIQGKVIGWYDGPFEWGPRALGGRSIIADPRRGEMKDIVNIKIKFREPFRPFAPSVLAEKASEYFRIPTGVEHYPPRFMLYVAPVVNEHVPAITHADNSSRPQLVHKNTSPRYHRLIEMFENATGVPLILNTSFNLKGEPIVGSPADALNTFRRSGMDVLVMGNVLVMKD